MKVAETHFVLEVQNIMGQHSEDLRKVHQLDRIANTYIIERYNGRGAVVYKDLSEDEFKKMSNALTLKLYKQEEPDEVK